jgi:hypothetical protein
MSIPRRFRPPLSASRRILAGDNGAKTMSLGTASLVQSSVIRGPSGLTDSEESDDDFNSPGFSFLAPSGYTGKSPRQCR